jgi:hypothetical protein
MHRFSKMLAFQLTLLTGFPPLWGAESSMVATTETQYSGAELFAKGAWCWFADPRAVRQVNAETGSDKTWLGCIDTDGVVKALQYDAVTGITTEVILDTEFQPDDHNNPTFLVLPDRRVMIFWSMHTAEPRFYYRVSKAPDDITEMGERKVVSVEGYGNYTYPSPFYLASAPDSFFVCWRGVRWHPTIARYSLPDENGDILQEIRPTQIVQSSAARPYAKYDSNGHDRIYFAFTTGHPDNEMPNWLYYAELDVNTFELYDVTGERLANVEESPFRFGHATASGPLVVDNPVDFKNWVWDLARDASGFPVIAQVRLTPDARSHNYFHSAWTGSEWRNTFLAHGGGWFHQHPRHAERCYSGGLALDHGRPDTVYMSVPTKGRFGNVYEIWQATVTRDGTVEKRQLTQNSEKNNVRPYVTLNSDPTDRIHLTWMNGDYYYWIVNRENPLGFPTRIMRHDVGAWNQARGE